MGCTDLVLRIMPVLIVWSGVMAAVCDSAPLVPLDETLAAIRACIEKSPAPWPEAWQREYIEAIRPTIVSAREPLQSARRLQILRSGFPAYWDSLKKSQDRSLFEVHLAQIRWYVESLMNVELGGEDHRQKLRDQYKDLVEYAARSLLAQFPFLDPNIVQTAKMDHLAQCYRNIEAPLVPIFLRPFSEGQVDQIKERWHTLRYVRVDIWRQLGGGRTTSPQKADVRPTNAHPDYLLTQRSLGQFQGQIWSFVPSSPDYYRNAVRREIDVQKRRLQSRSQMRKQEMRLEGTALRTEYLSFLLATLLETPQCLVESRPEGLQAEARCEQGETLAQEEVMPMR